MGKQAARRRLEETEAQACLRGLRTSPRKLNLVAQAIRGKDAGPALAELTFSKRRIAGTQKNQVVQISTFHAQRCALLHRQELPLPQLLLTTRTLGVADDAEHYEIFFTWAGVVLLHARSLLLDVLYPMLS